MLKWDHSKGASDLALSSLCNSCEFLYFYTGDTYIGFKAFFLNISFMLSCQHQAKQGPKTKANRLISSLNMNSSCQLRHYEVKINPATLDRQMDVIDGSFLTSHELCKVSLSPWVVKAVVGVCSLPRGTGMPNPISIMLGVSSSYCMWSLSSHALLTESWHSTHTNTHKQTHTHTHTV